MNALIIIPARLESKRLPGKVLKEVAGKTLLQHTYERAKQVSEHIVIASSDKQLLDHASTFCPLVFYSPSAINGTQRCLQVMQSHIVDGFGLPGLEKIVNWQVDEPLVEPSHVSALMSVNAPLSTLAYELALDCNNHHVVKVVSQSGRGNAYWFSRAPMAGAHHHVGIYAFDLWMLMRVGSRCLTPYSVAEDLEQLAWMEHGCDIAVLLQPGPAPLSINTEDDWLRFASLMETAEA